MKLLITGATGFLGSHIVKVLLASGHDIVILKRSFSDIWRIREYVGEIQSFDVDIHPVETVFEKCGRFDCVIHTATSYGRRGESASEVFESNLAFPLRLLEAATLFNTTTFFNTTTTLHACLNHYALSKRQFEDWGKIFAGQGKIQFVNLRLEHMYGPEDDSSKFTTWVIQSCLSNVDRIELTLGEQLRDFICIDDVVDAYKLLLENNRQLGTGFLEFNLGSGKAVSIREFVETAGRLTGTNTKFVFGAQKYRVNEIMHSEADISMLAGLGWKPKYDLIAGLKKMIDNFK